MATPIAKFNGTISRCVDLISLSVSIDGARNQDAELAKKVSHEPSDITRAAVVLSVSAMDSYFTDKFADLIVPYLKKNTPGDRLCKVLTDAGLDTQTSLELLGMDRPYRRLRTLIENYFAKYTTQRSEIIDNLFLCYGLRDFTKHVNGLCRTDCWKNTQKLITRRHEISHEADLDKYGRLRPIDTRKTLAQVKSLILFVMNADKLLDGIVKKKRRIRGSQG